MNPALKPFVAMMLCVMMTFTAFVGYCFANWHDGYVDRLATFATQTDLENYFRNDEMRQVAYEHYSFRGTPPLLLEQVGQDGSNSYSNTNVQVAGVDEEDFVKTDGIHICVASTRGVNILKAYPPEELSNLSYIPASALLGGDNNSEASIRGLFLSLDRLVVIADVDQKYIAESRMVEDAWSPEYITMARVIVGVFDISNPAEPSLAHSAAISGHALTSRMIGDCVYLVTEMYAWFYEADDPVIPSVWDGEDRAKVALEDIRYDPDSPGGYSFVNILSLKTTTREREVLSVIAGYSSDVYMSERALYFTVQKWEGAIVDDENGNAPRETSTARTSIYKIRVDGLDMADVARGDVKGWLLNQFSMDEHDGYLRVVTTTGWSPSDMSNAVYVLDDSLDVTGSVLGIAPEERIYSARFVGHTLYLVTFMLTDPLFVIDVGNPREPRIVGELEMPGFSSYLHPVDDDHVLGIGMEAGRPKVDLFDVSDPSRPSKLSEYLSDVRGWSIALSDHKAVLFDAERKLLVVPVQTYSSTDLGYVYTSGAYVFNVSVAGGIQLRGVITHAQESKWDYNEISRSLYINDCLYTVGTHLVQANRLSDLSYVASLQHTDYNPWYYLGV